MIMVMFFFCCFRIFCSCLSLFFGFCILSSFPCSLFCRFLCCIGGFLCSFFCRFLFRHIFIFDKANIQCFIEHTSFFFRAVSINFNCVIFALSEIDYKMKNRFDRIGIAAWTFRIVLFIKEILISILIGCTFFIDRNRYVPFFPRIKTERFQCVRDPVFRAKIYSHYPLALVIDDLDFRYRRAVRTLNIGTCIIKNVRFIQVFFL